MGQGKGLLLWLLKCASDFNAINHRNSHNMERKVYYIVNHDATVEIRQIRNIECLIIWWVGYHYPIAEKSDTK